MSRGYGRAAEKVLKIFHGADLRADLRGLRTDSSRAFGEMWGVREEDLGVFGSLWRRSTAVLRCGAIHTWIF